MNAWGTCLAGVITVSAATTYVDEPGVAAHSVAAQTVVSGLEDPVGIAVDPFSGAVFVAEPGEGRVVVVMGRSVIGSSRPGFEVVNAPPPEVLASPKCRAVWNHPRLRRPVDVAFDKAGRLFVAESEPCSRILMFDIHADGFSRATVVASSPSNQRRIYSFINFDEKDRLCAISFEVGSRNPSPRVEVFMPSGDGRWACVERGSNFMGFPFSSGRIASRRSADATHAGLEDPVLDWLYADPAFGRMTFDPASGHVYATMRGRGTVIRVEGPAP